MDRMVILAASLSMLALVTTVPPGSGGPAEPIDAAGAVAGIETIVGDNPSVDYPAVNLDACPFGEFSELVAAVEMVAAVDPAVVDGPTNAWVNPDEEQPGVGCWIEANSVDVPDPTGVAHIEVYARSLRGLPDPGVTWSEDWTRDDESERPYGDGRVAIACLTNDADWAAGERDCIARYVDEAAGMAVDVEVWSYDESATAEQARAALDALLPSIVSALAGAPSATAAG